MKKSLVWLTLVALALPVVVFAQGGGMPQMSPEMQAKMKAWQKWRENNKHVASLQQTLGALPELDKDPKTKLKPDQAKKILGVINTWKGKPAITNEQALQINKQITGVLNNAQIKKIATSRGGRGGGGGMGFGGGQRRQGGPGGGGANAGGNGARRNFDPSKFPSPKNYNPLNPATSPFVKANPERGQRMKQRMNDTMKMLQARASGK